MKKLVAAILVQQLVTWEPAGNQVKPKLKQMAEQEAAQAAAWTLV